MNNNKTTYSILTILALLALSSCSSTKENIQPEVTTTKVQIENNATSHPEKEIITPALITKTDLLDLLKPIDKSIYEEQVSSVSIKVKIDSIDELKLYVNNFLIKTIKIKPNRDTYCETVSLNYGENIVKIVGYKDGKEISEVAAKVYFLSKLLKKYKYAPNGYKKSYFHNTKNESKCVKCHKMDSNEVQGVAFENPKSSNCYDCHKDLMNQKYAHNEKNKWACSSCHGWRTGELNQEDAGKSKFLFPDPIDKTCFSCHKKEKKLWDSKKIKHEPYSLGQCNKCHNSHSSDHKNIIRSEVNKLCISCHAEKEKSGHVVSAFSSKKHPTSGVKDPTNKNRDLGCSSCHNPHASNASFLTQNDYSGDSILCVMCHKK